MKKIFLIVITTLFFPLCLFSQERVGINFDHHINWKETITKASIDHKFIFIDAYTTWCGPCKMMDQRVYPSEVLGTLMNKDFISIKIQMDSTTHDDEYVKSWYKDADSLKKTAAITAYPCFLFFSSEGELIYKSFGYRDVNSFANVVKFASAPERKEFRNELQLYQKGTKNYSKMPDLAKTTNELLGDHQMAFAIAKDYKENYLDILPIEQKLKEENLRFIDSNGGALLLSPTDSYFYTAYNYPKKIDSILGTGSSDRWINGVISNAVVHPILFKGDSPVTNKPNWTSITKKLKSSYPKIDVLRFILNEKIGFYKKVNNWDLYTLYKSESIMRNPPKTKGMELFFELNSPAWDVFKNSDNKPALTRALKWSSMSIRLEKDSTFCVQYLDTKANLLYKLGRVRDAINAEHHALYLSQKMTDRDRNGKPFFQDDFLKNIVKMRKGEPTWFVPGSTEEKKQ